MKANQTIIAAALLSAALVVMGHQKDTCSQHSGILSGITTILK